LLEAGALLPARAWTDLATLCDTPWLPALGWGTAAAARLLRRRLLRLSSPPLTVEAAAARARGELVHVAGEVAPLGAARAGGALWQVTRAEDVAGAWLEEEAEDFLLTDHEGGRLCVLVEGGHLVGGERLQAGDAVSVFGLFDELPDRTGLFRTPHGRGGVAPALRSGSDWPLLVSIPGEPHRPATGR
jgi:hypothetical protein